MPWHWTLRWFAMLILFALSTVAFSSYAGASTDPSEDVADESPPPDNPDTTDPDDADTNPDTDGDVEVDGSGALHQRRYDTTSDYMVVLTRSAVLGAVLGTLVGASIYLISQRDISAWTIAYFAAGGVFFGATVGTIQILTTNSDDNSDDDDDHIETRLDTFDEALHREARSRKPAEFTIPLLQLSF